MTYPDTYVTNLYLKWEKDVKKMINELKKKPSSSYVQTYTIGSLHGIAICMLDLANLKAQLLQWEIRKGLLKKPKKR